MEAAQYVDKLTLLCHQISNSVWFVLFNIIQHKGFFQPVKKSVKIISLQKKPTALKLDTK